jgi:hypothetical protein
MPAKSDCVAALMRASNRKDITRQEAEAILEEIENLSEQKRIARKISQREAMQAATEEFLGDKKIEALLEKRQEMLQAAARLNVRSHIQRFKNVADGVESLLKYTPGSERGVEGGMRSVEIESEALALSELSLMQAKLDADGVSREFQRGEIDTEIAIEIEQLSMEGGKPGVTGNSAAKKIAAAVFPTLDGLVDMKNRHGSWIRKVKGYVARQTHDKMRIRDLGGKDVNAPGHKEASFQAWRALILPLLDIERTFGIYKQEKFLRNVHDNLYSGEFSRATVVFDANGKITDIAGLKPEVSLVGVGGSTAKKLSASRVLHFKDAESSMKYFKALGSHDTLYEAVLAQVNSDARNITLMRIFGPDAERGYKQMLVEAAQIEKARTGQVEKINSSRAQEKFNNAWKAATGQLMSPVETGTGRFADLMLTLQSVSKLFGATFTSIGDVAFIWHAMRSMGVGRIDAATRVMRSVPEGFKAFRPFAREGNEAAMFFRLNSVAADAMSGEIAARFGSRISEMGRNGFNSSLKKANEMFFRANFLTQWTESVKAAAFHAHASLLGELAHLDFAKLPKEVATTLSEQGISAVQWGIIKKNVRKIDGRYFLGADQLVNADVRPMLKEFGLKDTAINRKRMQDELRTRVVSYFRSFQNRAVPSPGMHERIIQTGGGKSKDTLSGMLYAFFWQFKTFPLTVLNKVVIGNYGMAKYMDKRGSYFADVALLVAATTITGYLSGMFKDLAKGRTPKPLYDEKKGLRWQVLSDAALRGGALGIYGDMLFQQYDNSFRTFTTTMAGPFAGSVLNPSVAGVQQLVGAPFADDPGKELKKAGKTAYQILGDNMPKAGAAHLLIKPVFDYTIGYSINEFFQPGWENRYRKRMKENGQELFGFGDPR